MNELISLQPQTINGNTIETVSARELHAFVESKQQFATWIKNRISEYDFVENQDFVCVSQKNETQRADGQIGVSVSNEYYITLDMAKELAMVERNEKGKQARQYFIECEKKLKETITQKPVPLTFAEALRAYADEVEAHEATKQELTIAAPKADYFDGLVERNLLVNFTTFAKEIGVKRKLVIAYMLENGYLYRDQHNNLLPYAEYTPTLFEVKEYDKGKHAGVQTLLTPKGRETFRLLLG